MANPDISKGEEEMNQVDDCKLLGGGFQQLLIQRTAANIKNPLIFHTPMMMGV